MNLFQDFKIKFICKYDYTFWLHMAREFVIFQIVFWLIQGLISLVYFISDFSLLLGVVAGSAFALGVNTAYEWQDGLLNDGFNVIDFVGGILGILTSIGSLIILLNVISR